MWNPDVKWGDTPQVLQHHQNRSFEELIQAKIMRRLEAQGWEFYQTEGEWMGKHERYGEVRVKSALKVRLFG
jgi:hypothetical protein